jgi:hypothetical protein
MVQAKRRWLAGAGLAVLVVASAACGGSDDPGTTIRLTEVGRLRDVVYSDGALWVAGDDGSVVRFDPDSRRVLSTVDVSEVGLNTLASIDGGLVADNVETRRVDSASGTVTDVPEVERLLGSSSSSVWSSDSDGAKLIDVTTGAVRLRHRYPSVPVATGATADGDWILYRSGIALVGSDGRERVTQALRGGLDTSATGLAVDGGDAWIVSGRGDLERITAAGETLEVTTLHDMRARDLAPLWETTHGIAAGLGSVWVVDQPASTLYRFTTRGALDRTWEFARQPLTVTIVGDEVWVGHTDGRLTVLDADDLA